MASAKPRNDLLSVILDMADVPIFGIDANGRVNLLNRAFSDMTGFHGAEIIEMTSVQDIISPEHLEMFNGCVTKIRHGGQCEKMEFAIVAADRCKLYMVAKGYLQQPSADIVFVGESLKILSEIDEETYHIDERVLKAGKKLNTAIFGVDFHGRIFEWNDKLVSLSGFTREEMVGKSLIQDVISREHTAAIKQILDQVLSGMECDSLEFPIITSDLRRIDLLFATTARRDARGKITGMIAIGLDITERKQMEVEKTRVAQELQTFIDTTNAPIFGIDSHGLVNEWNEKCVSITGFTRSEVLGRNLVQDFITQEYQFSVQGVIDDALQGREAANFEFPFYTKDNRRVEVLLNATTRRDFGGNVVGVLCIGQDITERKQVEVEKTRVAQELQTFIDTANAPIFGIDADGLVNEWNNKSAAITGFAREEVLGKNLVQVFITQEYQVSVKEVLDNALHGRETANFEFPLYTKDQRRVDVLLNATTRRDVSGNVVGVLGVGQDITERKQIEVEKTRVAQELQTFIDTANAPIFGIDADGLVNEWNNKSAAITGFSREEVLGRNLVQDFITMEYQVSVKEVLDNALQGRETANFEFPLYTKDQRRVEVLLNATTRRDVYGHVLGVLGVGQDITERKQVEMEKARVAKELQTFIDTANAPIFGINAHGQVNEWNNKAATITGFAREEVLGKNLVQDFITKEYQVSVKEVLDNALQGRETANFEFPLYTKDQRRVDVLLNATTRRDVSGNVVGVLGVGQDITERKQVEVEKTRVAQELQTFINTANAPIFGIDANGLVNEWNNKSAEITGFSRQEVLGKNLVQDFITKEYQVSVKEVLDNALHGREAANFEFPLYTRDQRRVEVLLNATTRRDVGGNVVGVLGVGQDITERKQVEVEKTRVAQELQTFIDTANAPIFGIDANGLVNEWNNKSAAITGFSCEEVLGRNLVQDFITKEYQVSVKEVLDNALRGREAANFEFPLYTKDQRRVEVLLNATTRRDVSGNVVGVIGVGQDITERKQVEMEKTRVAQELQTFIDTANAPIFGIDANGLVNEWNNKSAAITGFSRKEVLGRNLVQDFITKEYQVSVLEVLDNALQGRETANFEFPLYTKDQRRVDVLLNATTRRDVNGYVVGVLGVGQDITERKQVEIEKTRVAQELQTFIDTANAPIFGIDANGLVNEWNNKAAEITGFSKEEVFGKDLVRAYITEEFRASVKHVLDKALSGMETANFEFPLFTKNERRVEVLLNATTRRDVTGAIVGVIGVGQDITERKHAEEEKARVALELQTFIDTANAPIFGIDAKGLVNEWNNKAAAITGFSRKEVLGKDLVEVYISADFRASVNQVLENALQGQETANFEFPLYTKDQRRVEVLLNATTRRDVSGNVVGVLGVGQDITERKQVEVEKARVAQELRTFIDTANAPIFGIDANGMVNEWNNKAAAITGFAREEVLGKNLVQDFITKEYQGSVSEVLDNALQGIETANFEFPLYTKDQRRVEVLFNATTRRDVSGSVVGVLGVGQDITERKQVEVEKTRVAQELQTFIDTANAPIFGIDANGLVNEWNNKAAAITGFSRHEVLGRNLVQDFITKEYQVSVREVLDNALQGREAANFEFPLYTRDQWRVEVLLNATTRRDVSGNVVGVLGVGQDITERKQVEIEKTRVAQELQTFIDTANAPIFGIDANGLVNEWNNKSAAITGFSREEVLGKNLVEVYITQEYRESVKMVLDNALKGKETANFEFPLFTADKRRVEVLLNATTRRDVSGNVVGVLGVGQDITERKQVEEEKTRVGQELQTFIDTANAPIFGIDANGLVNEWNNKSAEITGFSKHEVMGKDLVQVYITEEFRASVREVLDNALQGVEKSNFEFPLFTKDSRRVEVLLNATTRRDVTGAIVGVIGVGQDITEMRRLMEQETLLFQAQAANDAKSQFLATMSHEMRTPLNVIMGMNELVMDTPLTDEQRKFSQQIKTSSESLLVLINDILDLTKIEAGKLELVSVEFDLRTALEDAVDSVAGRAMAKGLEICCYMDPAAQTRILGDPDRLRQILLNLFSNGIKFTAKGQVYVVVEMEEVTATHQTFRFKVYDSGIGISAEGQKKLFNRFSQVDSSTTRTYGGTGLGLAISKQFAELMDGSMGVQSEVGKGSLFWFTAVFKRSQVPSQSFPPLVREISALLVAQNETLRNILLRYVESFGLHPTCVSSMEKAEALCLEREYDLLIVSCEILGGSVDSPAGLQGQRNPDIDRLHMTMRSLAGMLQGRSNMKSIVLCPITQLSHCAAYKDSCGFTLMTRPVRLAGFHQALVEAASQSAPVREQGAESLSSEDAMSFFGRENAPTVYPSVAARRTGRTSPSFRRLSPSYVRSLESDAENDGGGAEQGVGSAGPVANASSDHDAEMGEQAARPEAEVGDGDRRLRILVVDDDSGQRLVMKMMLIRSGFEVDVAEDGAQAIKATARVVYDAVLMDGFMPIKTGWDATKEIREREAATGCTNGLIIIGVTGATTSEDARKCLDFGMTDFIAKPIDRASINAKIRYWTERHGRGSCSRRQVSQPLPEDGPDRNASVAEQRGPAPRDMAISNAAMELTRAPSASSTSAMHINTICILIMTDAGVRAVLKAILKQISGAEIEISATLSEMMEKTQQECYSLVILDADSLLGRTDTGISDSGTSGFHSLQEVIDTIRASQAAVAQRSRPIPIIGIANCSVGAEGLASLSGFSAILCKPLSRDSVHAAVRAQLAGDQDGIRRRLADGPHGAADSSAAALSSQDDMACHPVRILIVEDHWANRKLLESMLRQRGYDSECVENGLEAVNIAASKEYDLVLMDCNMPIMDGWQATEKIRQQDGPNQRTPIIAVTANAMKGDRDKCLAAGMDDYLSKPVDRKLLYEAISKWTQGRNSKGSDV